MNIDIALLCIVSMVSVNWIQRLQCGEKPLFADYSFFPKYLIGGAYALMPIDINPDAIPLTGSMDDVIVVWLLVLYCLIKER